VPTEAGCVFGTGVNHERHERKKKGGGGITKMDEEHSNAERRKERKEELEASVVKNPTPIRTGTCQRLEGGAGFHGKQIDQKGGGGKGGRKLALTPLPDVEKVRGGKVKVGTSITS